LTNLFLTFSAGLGGDSWKDKSEMEVKRVVANNLFCRGEDEEDNGSEKNSDRMDYGLKPRSYISVTSPLLDEDNDSSSSDPLESWIFEGVGGQEDEEEEESEVLKVKGVISEDNPMDNEDKVSNELCAAVEVETGTVGSPLHIKEEPEDYHDEWGCSPDDFITQSVSVKVKEEVRLQSHQPESSLTSGEDRRRSGRSTQPPEKFTPSTSFKKPKPDPSIPKPMGPSPVKKRYKSQYRYRPNRIRPARDRARIARYPFACTEESCTKRFASELLLTCHIREVHLNLPRPYKCPECSKEANKFKTLVDHMLSYHPDIVVISTLGRPYLPLKNKCPSCSRSFKDSSLLDMHISTHHNTNDEEMKKKLPFECHVCEKRFETQEQVTEHFDNIHKDNPNPFTCEDCQSVFKNSVSLRYHRKRAHPLGSRVKCEICKDRLFPSEAHLKLHMANTHRTEPFKCPHCDFMTVVKAQFERHKREVHEDIYASVSIKY